MSETKSAEQIAAEQKLQSDVKTAQDKAATEKEAADKKAVARLEAKKKKAGDVHFVRDGVVYAPVMPKVHIPGLGDRTALEICADEEAQDYLINEGCVGSVLRKF